MQPITQTSDAKSVIQGFTEHLERAKRPVKVLLVDDYKADRLLGGRVLEQLGYAYDEAENGNTALRMMALKDYDVVFLDLSMPGIGGAEVLKQLKKIGNFTPVAIMSGNSEGPVVEEALLEGALLHIQKPLTLPKVKQLFSMLKL